MINQNFSQQILKGSAPSKDGTADDGAHVQKMGLPNPFFDEAEAGEGVEPAQVSAPSAL